MMNNSDKIKELTKKWEKLGLLKGLKGNVKPELAKLFESKHPIKING